MTDEELIAAMEGGGYPAITEESLPPPQYPASQYPQEEAPPPPLPEVTQPPPTAPSQIPNQNDIMRQLARNAILGPLTAPPPNPQGLAQAQQQGNVGAIIQAGIGGLGNAVGTPYGGMMNPAAYLGALATNRAQNFNQGGYAQEQAQNLPVQQFMQRQAQGQLGMQQRKQAAEDAIKLLREEGQSANYESLNAMRQAKLGGGTYTPEQVKAAQDDIASQAKLVGLELPPEYLASVTPANVKDDKRLLQQRASQLDRANQAEARAEAHLKETQAKGTNQAARQSAQAALQAARLDVQRARLGLQNYVADARTGGMVPPGVTTDTYANAGQVRDWSQLLNSTTSAVRVAKEITDLYKQGGGTGWTLLPPTERQARIRTFLEALQPLANAAEFKQAATQAHMSNVASQVGNPTALANLANDKYFPAKIDAFVHLLSKSLKTRAAASFSGGQLNQEPGEEIKPGLVKTAPEGRPGSKAPRAVSVPPIPGNPNAPQPEPMVDILDPDGNPRKVRQSRVQAALAAGGSLPSASGP